MVAAVGDVCIVRDSARKAFAGVAHEFARADTVIGNCERPYGESSPCDDGDCHACAFRVARFAAFACANNHAMDEGPDALQRTLRLLQRHGIATAGAGRNLADATRTAFITVNDVRVAIVARTAVAKHAHVAATDRPGVALLGVTTEYRNVEGQPGSPPQVITTADATGLAELCASVSAARAAADCVLVSLHGGVHFLPYVVADYERAVARAVIDAGAHAVLGHHQHILKGVELHRGRPILYGLGNFICDAHIDDDQMARYEADFNRRYLGYGLRRTASYPTYPFHPLARLTMIARLHIDVARDHIEAEVVPCTIERNGLPMAHAPRSSQAAPVWRYLQQANRHIDSNAEIVITGHDDDARALVRERAMCVRGDACR